MKFSHNAISNVTAAIIIVVILIVGVGATYYFVSSSSSTTTVVSTATSTGTVTTTSTGIVTTTSTGTVTTTSTATSTSSAQNYNVDPHPNQLTVETWGGGPQFVDPAVDYETSGSGVIQNVNEQLMFFKGADATQVVPWLASSQTMSTNGTVYTYQLRQGLKFSDGTPFNSSAVYFSIMRTLVIDDPSGPGWALDQVLRGAVDYSQSFNAAYGTNNYTQAAVNALVNAAPITIDGPYTVSFHLIKPYAAWPFIMAFSPSAIVSPSWELKNFIEPPAGTGVLPANAGGDGLPAGGAAAGDYQDAIETTQAGMTVGTGPYILQSWDRTTGDVTLVANPNYWGGPDGSIKPTIQTVVLKQVNDPNTRELDLKTGTADIGNAAIPIATGQIFDFVNQTTWTNSQTIQNIQPYFSVKGPFAELETDFAGLEQQIKNPDGSVASFQPFQDPNVRAAMAYLFDDNTFANQVEKGFSPLATQIIPPGMYGYNSSLEGTPLNVTIATNLLLAAGPKDGFGPNNPQTVNIGYNTGSTGREDAAIILASNINSIAKQTGLYANVVTLPWPQYLSEIRTHQLGVWFVGWIVDYVDPDDFLVPFASGTAGTYAIWSGFDNTTIDSWVTQEQVTSNGPARAAIINNIQSAINNGHYYIWSLNGVDLNEARTWIQEKPNAFVASNIGNSYLTSLYQFYYASIEPTATS